MANFVALVSAASIIASVASESAQGYVSNWSSVVVAQVGRGRYQLLYVPQGATTKACARLLALGVTKAKVAEPGVISFQCKANHAALAKLTELFGAVIA